MSGSRASLASRQRCSSSIRSATRSNSRPSSTSNSCSPSSEQFPQAHRHHRIHGRGCRRVARCALRRALRRGARRSSGRTRSRRWPMPMPRSCATGRRSTASCWRRARRLKVVGRLGVGLDNIDIAGAVEARGIDVIPATGANAQAVAEYVIATAHAAAARRIFQQRRGRGGRVAARRAVRTAARSPARRSACVASAASAGSYRTPCAMRSACAWSASMHRLPRTLAALARSDGHAVDVRLNFCGLPTS